MIAISLTSSRYIPQKQLEELLKVCYIIFKYKYGSEMYNTEGLTNLVQTYDIIMIGIYLVNIHQIEIVRSNYYTIGKVLVQLKALNLNNSVCKHGRGPVNG